MVNRSSIVCGLIVATLWVVGCSSKTPTNPAPPEPQAPADGYGGGYGYYGSIEFKDDAETNATIDPDDLNLTFVDIKGNTVKLADFRGKKNAVLVFTRGIPATTGAVCPFCTTQTSRLAANYDEFARRDTEVLAVFPGDKSRVDEFRRAVEIESKGQTTPFPLVLDEQFVAVDQLGIRGDLAKPSTYIVDKQGLVRFAYVGAHAGDRPSIKALLRQLDVLSTAPDETSESTATP